MAKTVAPQSHDADNNSGSFAVACSEWHGVGRFHEGTSQQQRLINDAGYTTARVSVAPLTLNRAWLFGGSPYTSVRRELSLIGCVLKSAVIDWSIPLPGGIPQVRMPKVRNARTRRLRPDEENGLLSAIESPAMRRVVTFAIETAMRRGEIASLRWEEVDLNRRIAHLPVTKTDNPRHVPLSPGAMAVLSSATPDSVGSVFNLRPDSITQAFNRACARCGIEGLNFHDLRHEAISRFFEFGLSTAEVASISGHKDFRILARYTHLHATDIAAKLQLRTDPNYLR